MRQVKVLFVCTGNICRSPTAEGVFKRMVAEAGMEDRVASDSAGTHNYHVGEAPDPRTQRAAERRGYDLAALRARQVSQGDFEEFDYVLAMDQANMLALQNSCPERHSSKLRLLMEFGGDPAVREVPDPYYGGAQGFERVIDLVERASKGLIRHLQEKYIFNSKRYG